MKSYLARLLAAIAGKEVHEKKPKPKRRYNGYRLLSVKREGDLVTYVWQLYK